jgi:hypothetical protein
MVIQLDLVYVVDIHRMIDVVPRESGHYHAVNQSKLVYRAWIHSAMPTSVLPLLQDSTR